MKADVLEVDGTSSRKVDLPPVFDTPLRPDLVRRAYWLLNSHRLQPKGRDPMAGERTTAETHSPPTGTGQSRIPRVKGERYPRSGLAGGVASVVKGRLAHPPRSEKVVHLKINKRERRLATNSAIAFTSSVGSVQARGHRFKAIGLPVVATDDLETVSKTSELVTFLEKVGLGDEVARLYDGVKRNSGKGRRRGRVYRERVGPLFVVTNDRGIGKAASAIPGIEVDRAESLNLLELAPGGEPGRLTIWTESAIASISNPKEEAVAQVAA
ncbi:MAG TPA: 50S ribosomal protein L4 [Nitrososphaerales archaeon]|nr:50S ribosomal protein L4 [Nitrososphaerales archaeon]